MKKITLIAALLGSAYFANAQVGIGTPTPANSSMLHIEANNKGVIIPNVSLTSTTNFAPITGDQKESLLVYNIADTGTGNTAVTPGFYYWQNNVWQRITTKAELDAAIGNVTVIQTDLGNVKKLLQTAYPANNLDTDTTADTVLSGGGMVFTPGSSTSTVGKIEYVYFNGTDYVKQDITKALQDFIGANETVTSIVTYNKKQYYLSESFNGDTNTSNWTTVPTGAILIDVVGAVVNNFNDIIGDTTTIVNINGDTTTIAQYFQSLASDSNTVYFNNTNTSVLVGDTNVAAYTFYLKDANGNPQTINLSQIVKATETVTTLLGDSISGKYIYTNEADSETLIDIPASVINNIQKILGDTTTINVDNRTFTTVEEYLQHIISKGDANVGYTTSVIAADSSTGQTAIPANSFYYVNDSGNKILIDVKSFETLTSLTGDSSTGIISYTPERGDTQTVNVVEMIANNFGNIISDTTTVVTINGDTTTIANYFNSLGDSSKLIYNIDGTYTFVDSKGDSTTINIPASVVTNLENIINAPTTIDSSTTTLVEYIQNMIDSSTLENGNVFYGNVDSSTNVLYTQNGDSKTVIDVVSTVVNNTTLTGNVDTDVNVTKNINKLKNNLGDVLKGDSNTNTSVFTGDTYIVDGVKYYIYKGIFSTTVKAGTAQTSGITLDKNIKEILSLSLNYNNGLTASVTDVILDSPTVRKVTMNIGVGKTYNVLSTSDILAKVTVEFASTAKPEGL